MPPDDALGRLAVIVPVGPGDVLGRELCEQLGALPASAELHVVCVDGADVGAATASAAPRWRRHTAPRGRAAQQNAGARASVQPWLWFLHVDSRLAPSTLPALAQFLAADAPALGFFDLRFHDGSVLMGLNTIGAFVRSRVMGLPFGDQGLVLPRRAFDALGGFDHALARGEDHDLVWRARRRGLPLRAIGAPLYTSARRYVEHGWLRTTSATMYETWRQARRFGTAAR